MSQPDGADSRPLDLELMRQALAPVVREALAPLYPQRDRATEHGTVTAPDAGGMGEIREQALLQAALEDAHARIRRLEQDNAQLHRELGERMRRGIWPVNT